MAQNTASTMKLTKDRLCTTLELSKLFGITRRDVLKLVAEGMPIIKRNQYDFRECFIWSADKDKLSDKEYTRRAKKINMYLIGKKFLQIERAEGIKNPNRDSKGKLRTSPEAWNNLLDKLQPILKQLRTKK